MKGTAPIPRSPLPLALLTAHCPARQELGGIASSSCGPGPDFCAGTGTRIRAQPLPETAPIRVRMGLVGARAPGTARSGRGFWRQGHFPNTSQPDCRPLSSRRRECPGATALKPSMHPASWEPSPIEARVSKVVTWSPAKGFASPLSRRSRNSAACSKTWMLLATGSMLATAGGGRAEVEASRSSSTTFVTM